jgi:NADH dehydrogenase
VTGSSGFIGRHFLAALRQAGIANVTAVSRRPHSPAESPAGGDPPGWRYLQGDLEDVATYSDALRGVDTVVHLAAATGNAAAAELHRINVDVTTRLVEAAHQQGVRHILYISSIAAKYRELADYPYGQSKRRAEDVVRGSQLEFTILRPTIVLGLHSPIWQRLRRLATLPAIVVIGNGSTRIQPVDVDDVARMMALIISLGRYSSEVLELGGPEILTFADLLRRIRKASGRGAAPLLRVPVVPLRGALRLGERLLGSRLPVSAGQLTPFLEDGVADPNDLATEFRTAQQPLDQLLTRLANHHG